MLLLYFNSFYTIYGFYVQNLFYILFDFFNIYHNYNLNILMSYSTFIHIYQYLKSETIELPIPYILTYYYSYVYT
jgi:hypothetical protein